MIKMALSGLYTHTVRLVHYRCSRMVLFLAAAVVGVACAESEKLESEAIVHGSKVLRRMRSLGSATN